MKILVNNNAPINFTNTHSSIAFTPHQITLKLKALITQSKYDELYYTHERIHTIAEVWLSSSSNANFSGASSKTLVQFYKNQARTLKEVSTQVPLNTYYRIDLVLHQVWEESYKVFHGFKGYKTHYRARSTYHYTLKLSDFEILSLELV
ncbi:hypothetical protein DMB95_00065 [Campylobacter sp. MIT 12-8780]|uniref:hypothetical protein n=1 Tax=unclassified Campylobacter TaxID=2593542 RepID=UPI00115E49F4|nr:MULTISPECIES: hypothetical protein [unclassified Campylobacter]NDJ26353.1 hypothetical protein [Campylobacter sp. MIT 19-121]TQR42930.1 hypothetical protein DMB95_00065 [Campylobacter sp. MIT 12-8780]